MTNQTDSFKAAHEKISSLKAASRYRFFADVTKVKTAVEDGIDADGDNAAGQQQPPQRYPTLKYTMWVEDSNSIYLKLIRLLGRDFGFNSDLQYFIKAIKQNTNNEEKLNTFLGMIREHLRQAPGMSNNTFTMNLLEHIKIAFEKTFPNQIYQTPALRNEEQLRPDMRWCM